MARMRILKERISIEPFDDETEELYQKFKSRLLNDFKKKEEKNRDILSERAIDWKNSVEIRINTVNTISKLKEIINDAKFQIECSNYSITVKDELYDFLFEEIKNILDLKERIH